MSSRWERLAGDAGGTVAGLAVAKSGAAETWVFAATPVGVYRSTDGGRAWTLPGVTSSVAFADVVAPSPRFAQDRTLFVCGADALHRSSDAGETWQRVLVGSRMLSVVISPGATREQLVALAGTESDGVLRSEDGGRTWVGANAGLLDLTALSLALSPCFETDRTGFAGTASGMYRTRNAGGSWRALETGVDQPAVQCLAVSPGFANDRLVLAGTEADGLLRSTDGGTSWYTPSSLAGHGITALAFTADAQAVAAATDSGIAISRDGGETWRIHASAAPNAPILSVVFVGDVLLAGLHRRGTIRSDDAGSTWQPANAGLSARLESELVLSPDFARDHTLFVGGLEDGLRASTDGGVHWEDRLQDVAISGLAASATYAQDRTVYAATTAGIRLSSDGAATWHSAWTTEAPARAVATGPGVVIAALDDGSLVASRDAGQTWRGLATPWAGDEVLTLAVSATFDRDHTLFVATSHGAEVVLWRSIDGGERWQRRFVQVQAGGGPSRVPVALAPSHAIDERVFVGLAGRVLRPLRQATEVRSGERRPIWQSVDLGTATVGVTALATSPAFTEDHAVFATTNAGVFVSRDGGESFEPWNTGLDQRRMVAVAVSPNYRDDRLVYGLGLGGTLWRRRDDPRTVNG